MLQVTQNHKTGETRIEDVPPPILKSGGLLVENKFSLVSFGTERSTIGLSQKGLIGKAKDRPDQFRQAMNSVKKNGLIATYKNVMERLDSPVPLGYSCAGIVRDVSEDVNEFKTGDRVACAGGGYASHAEVVFVPKNLCVRVPDVVSLDAAAFTTVGAIAIHGVRQTQVQIGEAVAVIGLGLVGLLTIQVLKAAGCSVLGVDIDIGKLQIASDLGADAVVEVRNTSMEGIALDFSKGRGMDAVIITAATSSHHPIVLAGQILRDRGKVVVVGSVGMNIPRKSYYEKELHLGLSRSYGPGRYDPLYEEKGIDYPIGYVRWTEKRNMEAFLALLSGEKLNVQKLTTHKFKIDDAEKAYNVVMGKTGEKPIGVLLEYDGKVDLGKGKVLLNENMDKKHHPVDSIGIGFVGAGNFARSFLLPNLKDDKSLVLKGVATGTGVNARHVARKFGFQYCTTDYREILDDPEVSAVVIATRHNLHAKIAVEAMAAHKTVFVEKPLALNEGELDGVIQAWRSKNGRIMVGYNRRFSKLVVELKALFKNRTQPLAINYRVNAGSISRGHWIQDPAEGGGRIIGEVCHFVDLAQFITGSSPARVFAESISAENHTVINRDNLSITIKFHDGSLVNIAYLANGDTSFPKERIEVFGENRIAIIDDFKRLQLIGKGKQKNIRSRRQDKGHKKEIQRFVEALKTGSELPIPFRDSVVATLLTFRIEQSLREGVPVAIDMERLDL